MLRELVKLANHLDSKGLVKEADYLDEIVKKAGFVSNVSGWIKSLLPGKDNNELKQFASEYALLSGTSTGIDFDPFDVDVGIKVKFLRQLNILHENAPSDEKGVYKDAIKSYVQSPRHKPKLTGSAEAKMQSAKDSYEFYRRANSDNTLGLIEALLPGYLTSSVDSVGATLKALLVDGRVAQIDKATEAGKEKVDRHGNIISG